MNNTELYETAIRKLIELCIEEDLNEFRERKWVIISDFVDIPDLICEFEQRYDIRIELKIASDQSDVQDKENETDYEVIIKWE